MHRSASLFALLGCLLAVSLASAANDIVRTNDVEVDPQVLLLEDGVDKVNIVPRAALGWGSSSTSRYRTTTPRYRPTTSTRRPTTRRSHDQSITFGNVYPYDRQLATKTVYKSATWLVINTETVDITSPSATIHCIQVVDQLQNGKNAVVTMTRGGIGQRSARLEFSSKRGEKISYLVIVWGQ